MVRSVPQLSARRRRPHWWGDLPLWRRALLVAALLGALVLSTGLIYYRPQQQAMAPNGATASPGPFYPPGIDEYYYWGQSQPLSQQP